MQHQHEAVRRLTGPPWPAPWMVPAAAAAVAVGAGMVVVPYLLGLVALGLAALWVLASVERGLYAIVGICFVVPVTISVGLPGNLLVWEWLTISGLCLVGRGIRLVQGVDRGGPSPWLLSVVVPLGLSALVSGASLHQMSVSWRPYVVLVLLVWHVTAEARTRPQTIRRLLDHCAWLGAGLALVAVAQRLLGSWPVLDSLATRGAYTSAAAGDRAASTLGHPLIYGTFSLAMMSIAITLRPRGWRWLALLNALGLVLSGTRSAWLALGVVLVVMLLTGILRIGARSSYVGLTAATALLAATVLLPGTIGVVWSGAVGRLADVGQSTSAHARALRVSTAWENIASEPFTFVFGHGPGSLGRFFGTSGIADQFAQTFDNSYLTLWFEAGLVSVVWLVAAFLVLAVRRRSSTARVLVIGFAVQALFFDFYNWPAASLILALAVAAATACRDDSRPGGVLPPPAQEDRPAAPTAHVGRVRARAGVP